MKFNEKLKSLRISKNMTQEDLAKKLNISRQSISKWEQGINEPSIETLKQICLILDVSINDLIDDDRKIITSYEEKGIKKERRIFLINCALVIIMFLVSLILIKLMNDKIPMHYDIEGNITRYGSKWEFLIIPSISIIFLLIFGLIRFKQIKKQALNIKTLIIFQYLHFSIQIVILISVIWIGLANANDLINNIIPFLTGITFSFYIALNIFTLPIINKKQNELFGFRTYFTLSNPIAWKKVNQFQSISALSVSIISYIIVLISFSDWNIYLLAIVIISIIPTLIYHEILKKKLSNK